MEFDVLERLSLCGLMPQQGSFIDLMLARDIQGKCRISQDEQQCIDFEFDLEKQVSRWDTNKAEAYGPAEIAFTETEKAFIQKIFTKLDDEEKLTPDLLDLYVRFTVPKISA